MVSFDPTDVERRVARALAASFIATAYSFEQAPAEGAVGSWEANTPLGRRTSPVFIVSMLSVPEPRPGHQTSHWIAEHLEHL